MCLGLTRPADWLIVCLAQCDMMLGICCVGVSASQRISLSVLMRNPHKRLVHVISHETRRRQGKESPRQNREEDRTEKWKEQSSQQERASNLLGSMDLEAGLCMLFLCVHKEIWNTPSWGWEKPLNDRMAMSGLGGWDSVIVKYIKSLLIHPLNSSHS